MRRHAELARLFLRLGATSFGGPAVHVANMHAECVVKREWLSAQEFLDMLAATNMIPGPNSTEMAIHIGYRRGGVPGLIIAGIAFILPAALIVGLLAWLYITYGLLPEGERFLWAVKPVVIAVILRAIIDLSRTPLKTVFLALLGLGAVTANLSGVSELPVLFATGVIAAVSKKLKPSRTTVSSLAIPALLPLFTYFLKLGSVLFGSGYILVAFLQADLVDDRHWLTGQQLLDAIAVGQLTPGPLFNFDLHRIHTAWSLGSNSGHCWNLSPRICLCRNHIAIPGAAKPQAVFAGPSGRSECRRDCIDACRDISTRADCDCGYPDRCHRDRERHSPGRPLDQSRLARLSCWHHRSSQLAIRPSHRGNPATSR
jgi:chromate transport protein ChrA